MQKIVTNSTWLLFILTSIVHGCSFSRTEVGPPDPSLIWAVDSNARTDADTLIGVTLLMRDGYGHPKPNLQLEVGVSSAATVVAQPRATDSAGLSYATIRCLAPGLVTLRAMAQVEGHRYTIGETSTLICPQKANYGAPDQLSPARVVVQDIQDRAAADIQVPILVTLVVLDAQGRPMASQPVTLSAIRAGDTIEPTLAFTDSQGRVTGALISTVLGDSAVVATAGAAQTVATVHFVAGPPDVNVSRLDAISGPTAHENGYKQAFRLNVKDSSGRAVPYAPVTMSSSVASDLLEPYAGRTDSAGTFATDLKGTLAGDRVVRANLSAGSLSTRGVVLTGPPSSARSLLSISPNVITADGSKAILALRLADINGNPLPDQSFVLGSSDANVSFGVMDGRTQADGTSSTFISSKCSGVKDVFAEAGGVRLLSSVRFVPGPSAVATSTLQASADAVADGVTHVVLTAVLRDASGNLTPGMAATFSASGYDQALSQAASETDSQGAITAQLVSTRAETKNVSLRFLSGELTTFVKFTAGLLDTAQSSLIALPDSIAADGADTAQLALHLRDAHNNVLVGVPVTFSASSPGPSLSVTSAITDTQGLALTQMSGTQAGRITVHAGLPNTSLSANVTLREGPPNSGQSSLSLTPNVIAADDLVGATVTVSVRDAFGNPVTYRAVTLSTSDPNLALDANEGITNSEGQWTTRAVSTSPASVLLKANLAPGETSNLLRVVPGRIDPSRSTLNASPNVVTADGQTFVSLILNAQDRSGNAIPGANVTWSSDGNGVSFDPPNATSDSTGQVSTKAVSQCAQNQNIFVDFQGQTMTSYVQFVPGPPDANRSMISIQHDHQPADGLRAIDLTVSINDAYGNHIPSVPIALKSFSNPAAILAPNGFTNSSGIYVTSITSTSSGLHRISTQISNSRLFGTVHFDPNPPKCSKTLHLGGPPLMMRQVGPESASKIIDLDGDGNLDLITASTISGSMSIFMGQGNNTYDAPRSYPFPRYIYPVSILTADLTQDGLQDILLGGFYGGAFYQNQGADGFAAGFNLNVGDMYTAALGDLNEDGKIDMVAGGGYVLGTFAGRGDGTFEDPVFISNLNEYGYLRKAVDFNNDGHLDIYIHQYGPAKLLLGGGDGTFSSMMTLPFESLYSVIEDFDGDGNLDVVAGDSNYQSSALSVYYGNGDGSFTQHSSVTVPTKYSTAISGDLNNDQKLDLAGCTDDGHIDVLINRGNGEFEAPVRYRSPACLDLLALDTTNTGLMNLVSASQGTTVVLKNRGDGSFESEYSNWTDFEALDKQYGEIVVADLFGDARPEIAFPGTSSIQIYSARDDALYPLRTTIPLNDPIYTMRASDLDRNGFTDLIVEDANANLIVLANMGNGTFLDTVVYTAPQYSDLEIGDFNGDKNPDILLLRSADEIFSVLYGSGDGSFASPIGQTTVNYADSVTAADINNDGLEDVIVNGAYGVVIHLTRPDNSFGAGIDLDPNFAVQGVGSIAVGDFDEDGFLDITVLSYYGQTRSFKVYRGGGDGSFLSPLMSIEQEYFSDVRAVDMDGDGHLDLVVTNDSVSILLGRGDGTFNSPDRYRAGMGLTVDDFSVADFDLDGRPDVLTSNERISILINTCPGH